MGSLTFGGVSTAGQICWGTSGWCWLGVDIPVLLTTSVRHVLVHVVRYLISRRDREGKAWDREGQKPRTVRETYGDRRGGGPSCW